MLDQTSKTHFSGSYAPEDVQFLLKPIEIEATPVAEKERLIQSGEVHYSEMISEERRPSQRYLDIFENARERGDERIAREMVGLSLAIKEDIDAGRLPSEITLCSLVRAGLPFGVVLLRELKALGADVVHFGISIIRDKGLDHNAMAKVMAERNADGIIFVDGWTGKGAISRELRRSWLEICGTEPTFLVQADPAGFAQYSGSHEDWLIPSGLLGACVSGLVSRSIVSKDHIGPQDFHGCRLLDDQADIDRSRELVDAITLKAINCRGKIPAIRTTATKRVDLRYQSENCVNNIASKFGVDNMNRIKPGIAEATRAVLRRRSERVFLSDADDPDVEAIVQLCCEDGLKIEVDASITGPYRALTLIEKVS
jgi:hypothetical protein